jgi:hypothetical protein
MAGEAGSEKRGCCASGGANAEAQPAGEMVTKVVKAQVPQEYDAKFNVRIVPGRSLGSVLEVKPHCKPRGHRQGWFPGGLRIDPGLVATLAKADKAVVAWLARDAANAQRFLANPVAAMRDAGVELSRAEEKALSRASAAAAAARQVGPGVNVASVTAQAFPDGRVGGLGSSKPGGKADDFDCGPKRKG